MPFSTELTRRLGIKVPVVQGGMQWVGYAELASAVSNAGGLGILTALTQPTPAALRAEIRRCKTLTPNPFGVNLTLLPALIPPDYEGYARAIIAEDIKIVETAGNSPGPVIKLLKAAGCTVLHKCTTIRHAQSAVKLGVDFLSIDGFECAGHVGESDITNFILLGRARQTFSALSSASSSSSSSSSSAPSFSDGGGGGGGEASSPLVGFGGIPFIASGGFADGEGLAAALALGACGINMGTRFMCTVEAPIHVKVKEAIVKAKEEDTELVLRRWRNTSRLFGNGVAKEAVRVERESATGKFEEVAPLVSGKRGREVFTGGDVEFGVWTAGQVIGLIHDIPTCAALLSRIEHDAEATIQKTSNLIIGSGTSTSSSSSSSTPSSSSSLSRSSHILPTGGEVGKNMNNPGAEIWGVGKSKL